MRISDLLRWSIVLGSAIAVAACAAGTKKIFTDEEIAAEFETRLSPRNLERIIIPFEINDEIRALAHQAVENQRDDSSKTRALVSAIIARTGMSISYDWLSNKTAQEVFVEGRGNCLAYTNLFIGMAREVGLEAVYVDVTTVERISKEAEVIVNNGHITGGVRNGPDIIIIDFTRTPDREYHGAKIIDDFEAIANYYNNQGFLYGYFAETLDETDEGLNPLEAELAMYKLALEVQPQFNRARNNLGVALKRRGHIDEAIEQYQMALDHDPKFAEARSNLGAAYYTLGRVDDAIREFERAAKSAGSNAYYYHHLGVIQYQQGNYRAAMDYFRKALSRESGLVDARYYLGETLLKLGERKKAIEAYEQTLEIDPNYLSARAKLDLLNNQLQNNEQPF